MNPVFIGNLFFNFIEVEYNQDIDTTLMHKIYTKEIDGVVVKNVFSEADVKDVLRNAKLVKDEDKLFTSTGEVFPLPFATIRNHKDDLDKYIERRKKLETPAFDVLQKKIQDFFEKIGAGFNVSVPEIVSRENSGTANFGNFRFFQPNFGGLFPHCGNLFRHDSPVYYEAVEDMDLDMQLSFFLALEYPEKGGELTIYKLLWPEVNGKDDFEGRDYVLNNKNEKIVLNEVKQFKVVPNPGDILVFNGGDIWHRVEEIYGGHPRITFGGFMNYSKDGKSFFYWS